MLLPSSRSWNTLTRHGFEWTRQGFQEWAKGIAERFGQSALFVGVGPEDEKVGAPTQMTVFERILR